VLQVWGEVIRYLLIAVVFEILIVSFILPRFERVRFTAKAAPSGAFPPVLRVNEKEIPLDRLSYIKSVEHYVELVTDEKVLLERAPLKALTAQLGAEAGIQPHRSYWVARRSAPVLRRAGDNHVLLLQNGTEIPVSRGRRKQVEAWLSRIAAE
jgi:DNA-binding LytR/AlgR family response regulator